MKKQDRDKRAEQIADAIGERLMSRIKKAGNVWNAERLMNRKERQGIVTEEDG